VGQRPRPERHRQARVLDLNGIDKLERDVPAEPGLRGDTNFVALGNIPVCGMNTSFAAEVTPAYVFLADVFFDGWQLSRHDDIWGGYILKKLMDKRGDLFTYGRPVVEHTRQSRLEKVIQIEHWMHLMSMPFYDIVDRAVDRVQTRDYTTMFADFCEAFRSETDRSPAPLHYRSVFHELGDWMQRWSACFTG
jgi:hypothetical protein